MDSWRIKTSLTDKTNITPTTSSIVGAFATKSPKGPKTFKLFRKGDVSGLISTFGYPSKEYPDIQDAIDVVAKSDLWVSSYYKNGKYGGVFVTPNGTVPFVSGTSEKTFDDIENVLCSDTIGIGNSIIVNFEKTIKNYNKVDTSSIKIYVDDTDTESTIEEGVVTSDLFTGTYTNGVLNLTFGVAPTTGSVISIEYNIDMSDTLFVLFNYDMQSDDLDIKVEKSTDVDDAFSISIRRFDSVENEYIELPSSPFVVGLSETSKDNTGTNIYIENVFSENLGLVEPKVYNSTIDSFTDDVEFKKFNGGNRGDTITDTELANVYDDLKDTSVYNIRYAFTSLPSSIIVSKFEELRNGNQKRCRFLYPTANVSPSTIISDSAHTYDFGVTNNRGLYQYVLTWGIHKDLYQGNNFMCSNMGLITSRLVDVLEVGGGVPAWIDENGVGGILGSSITKLDKKATEPELESLDKLGFNPVVMDNKWGAMIVGWRTRQVKENVYSYIGQSSLADTIIELIEQNVLPYRIGKLIDESSYSEVRQGCSAILKQYERYLEDYIVICSNENNDNESRASQKLYCTVGVIFKGYAQRVFLNFKSYKQGVDLQEEILKA